MLVEFVVLFEFLPKKRNNQEKNIFFTIIVNVLHLG